jgi:hypothetical protein
MATFYSATLENIESLEITSCELDDDSEIEPLKNFTKLTKLHLKECGLTNDQLKKLTVLCPNIREFCLETCPRIHSNGTESSM